MQLTQIRHQSATQMSTKHMLFTVLSQLTEELCARTPTIEQVVCMFSVMQVN